MYFLDSYAIIEILAENQNYERFKNSVNHTSLLNLLEVHNILRKLKEKVVVDKIIEKLLGICMQITVDDIKFASEFKINNKSKKFSYIDCLGYAIAFNKNLKFVTGDNEFKSLANV